MNWTRWVEFFEGDDKRLSMTRLLCFMSFFPASYFVLSSDDVNALGYYVGAYVLGYVGGKLGDCINRPKVSAE